MYTKWVVINLSRMHRQIYLRQCPGITKNNFVARLNIRRANDKWIMRLAISSDVRPLMELYYLIYFLRFSFRRDPIRLDVLSSLIDWLLLSSITRDDILFLLNCFYIYVYVLCNYEINLKFSVLIQESNTEFDQQ